MSVTIRGLVEAQEKMEQMVTDLRGAPMLRAMRDCTLLVQRDAKVNAPVDTGRLRASITPEVRSTGKSVQGVVGSNVAYAAAVEFGSRPNWVPISALNRCARRKGINAYAVQRAIAKRGTKPREYLTKALLDNEAAIKSKIENAVTRIVDKT